MPDARIRYAGGASHSSAGYVDGKSKALFGVSTRTIDQCREACGCDPCQAVAERLRTSAWVPKRGSARTRSSNRTGSVGTATGSPAGAANVFTRGHRGSCSVIELAEGDRSE